MIRPVRMFLAVALLGLGPGRCWASEIKAVKPAAGGRSQIHSSLASPVLSLQGSVPKLGMGSAPVLRPAQSRAALPRPDALPVIVNGRELTFPAAAPASEAGSQPFAVRVQGIRDGLSVDGRIDAGTLSAAYINSAAPGSAADLPGVSDPSLADLISDGAPRQALRRLRQLQGMNPQLRSGPGLAAVEKLAAELAQAPESAPVRDFQARLDRANGALQAGLYAAVMYEIGGAVVELGQSGFSRAARLAWHMELSGTESDIRKAGSREIYNQKDDRRSPAELAAYVRGLTARDPEAYVGAPLAEAPVRIQCFSDCAVQQAYNHPAMSGVAGQMPYGSFLNAVENLQHKSFRAQGMTTAESRDLFREIGLDTVWQGRPRSEAELAALLRENGALIMTVNWYRKSDRRAEPDIGRHAVVLRGAFRDEDGWNFVFVDSNRPRPRVMSFSELQVLDFEELMAVEPLPEASKKLPPALRGITDPEQRLRRAVNLFYGRYGVFQRSLPRYQKILFWPINLLRSWFGQEPIGRYDPNLIPWAQASAREKARAARAPPEAVVATLDGRKFLNRRVLSGVN